MFPLRSPLTISACLLIVFFASVCLPGCGGGGGGNAGPSVTVAITPAAPSVPVQGTQAFAAAVGNTSNTAVTWRVQEGANGGTITSAGLYTAPTAAGTYHVVAISQADPSHSSTVAVTVHTTVTVTPGVTPVLAGQTQQFTATVVGSSDTAVTWAVSEGPGGGTITAGGLYTAPNTPGAYHVTATTQIDSTVSTPAAAIVQGGNVQGTIQ